MGVRWSPSVAKTDEDQRQLMFFAISFGLVSVQVVIHLFIKFGVSYLNDYNLLPDSNDYDLMVKLRIRTEYMKV